MRKIYEIGGRLTRAIASAAAGVGEQSRRTAEALDRRAEEARAREDRGLAARDDETSLPVEADGGQFDVGEAVRDIARRAREGSAALSADARSALERLERALLAEKADHAAPQPDEERPEEQKHF